MTMPLAPSLGSRLLAGTGLLALLGGVSLAASRPARSVGGPVPVSVTNAPLSTTATDNPAKQGIQFQAEVVIPKGGLGGLKTMYTVLAGKRLVIETVSAQSNSFEDTRHYTVECSSYGGLTGSSGTGAFDLLFDGSPFPVGEAHPHEYADAGNSVNAIVERTESSGVSDVTVTVMGYLVDISGPGGS